MPNMGRIDREYKLGMYNFFEYADWVNLYFYWFSAFE